MAKIRLTEGQLKKIIKEAIDSVMQDNETLNEMARGPLPFWERRDIAWQRIISNGIKKGKIYAADEHVPYRDILVYAMELGEWESEDGTLNPSVEEREEIKKWYRKIQKRIMGC